MPIELKGRSPEHRGASLSRWSRIVLISTLAAAGCGAEAGRVAVQGSITLDGKPLDDGLVNFLPEGDGPAASAPVKNGAFSISAAEGPKPGSYLVEVRSIQGTGKIPKKPIDPDYASEETVDIIPPRYNRDTRLKAQVKAEGPNQFTFELESAPASGRPRGKGAG